MPRPKKAEEISAAPYITVPIAPYSKAPPQQLPAQIAEPFGRLCTISPNWQGAQQKWTAVVRGEGGAKRALS